MFGKAGFGVGGGNVAALCISMELAIRKEPMYAEWSDGVGVAE